MKHAKKLILPLLAFLLLLSPGLFAGQNPFGADERIQARIKKEANVYTPPPIVRGRNVQGTVDVGTALNVRSAPWGDIIGSLGPNARVTITGQVGDWYEIDYQGRPAYVHSAYVRQPGEDAKPFPRRGWVNAPLGLAVRRVPHGDKIGKLKDQTEVEILGVSGEFYKIKYGSDEAFVARKYIDTDMPETPGADKVQKENFIGYVSVSSSLNVRKAPWGAIETSLPNGIAVQVTGRIDDWYQINYNGKVRYIHSNYVVKDRNQIFKPGSNTTPNDPGSVYTGPISSSKIVQEANKLIGSTRFRGREVDGGNLACAQVVSTALVNAGAMNSVVLNVRAIVSELHKKGWKEASVPPFKDGDVITWKTYDYTGDGVKDPDTHVGIMVKQGSTMKAMNNSSRLRTPRYSDPYSVGPISRVLRKI